MVREEILRAVAEPKARDLRSEFLVIPEDLGPKDLRVVFQIAVQIGRADVQVGELAEGRRHDPESPSEAISVVGVPGVRPDRRVGEKINRMTATRPRMNQSVEPEDLTAYAFLSEPSLSPDASFVVIAVHRAILDKDEYEGNLWVVPRDGTGPRELTTAGKDSAPKIAPDGKRILFTSKRDIGKDDKGNSLYLIPLDGGEARLLLRRKQRIEVHTWPPDDRRLVFLGNDFPRGFASHVHLWSIKAAGGKPERLDSLDRNLSNSLNCDIRMGGMNSEPKWVGDRIYFVVAEGGAVHLYVLRVKDRKAELLVGGNRSVGAFQATEGAVVFTAMENGYPPEFYSWKGGKGGIRSLTTFNKDLD